MATGPDDRDLIGYWAGGMAEAPRRRLRPTWRPDSIVVFLALLVADGVVLLLAGALANGPSRLLTLVSSGVDGPCSTAWSDRAHDLTIGLFVLTGWLVLTSGVALWRRFHPVAVVLTQILVAAVLIPVNVSAHSDAVARADRFAHHRGTVPDAGPVRCDPNH